MSNLSTDMSNLRGKYREIFLETAEELTSKIEKMNPWQLKLFITTQSLIIKQEWESIHQLRQTVVCKKCASCCKLACSEFSPDELAEKSKNGDFYAQEFTKVFIPYENENDAKAIYPEYFELLNIQAKDEKVYFYHCKIVSEDNTCPDYENRPLICREFPDNPIAFLPKSCGFMKWKEKVEERALALHSRAEILNFYKESLDDNSI